MRPLEKILKRNKKKERKSIKEKFNPKINIYDSRGRIIGSLRQRESINYQELLLKKAEGIHKTERGRKAFRF